MTLKLLYYDIPKFVECVSIPTLPSKIYRKLLFTDQKKTRTKM